MNSKTFLLLIRTELDTGRVRMDTKSALGQALEELGAPRNTLIHTHPYKHTFLSLVLPEPEAKIQPLNTEQWIFMILWFWERLL